MPNNLTDDPTVFPSPVQVPAAGDPRTDTSVYTPFQQVANRTANTKARVDAIVPFSAPGYGALPAGVTSGVAQILTASSLAAVSTIPLAQRFDGMLCKVYGYGIYEWDISYPGPALGSIVLQANDIPAGPGRWVLVSLGLGILGTTPYGAPQNDSTGRVPAGSVRNGLVAYQSAALGIYTTVASTTLVSPTGWNVSLASLNVGDIIEARWSAALGIGGTVGEGGNGVVQVTGPGVATTPMSNSQSAASNPTTNGFLPNVGSVASYTVLAGGAGAWTVALYVAPNATTVGNSHTVQFQNTNLVVQVIRP